MMSKGKKSFNNQTSFADTNYVTPFEQNPVTSSKRTYVYSLQTTTTLTTVTEENTFEFISRCEVSFTLHSTSFTFTCHDSHSSSRNPTRISRSCLREQIANVLTAFNAYFSTTYTVSSN